MGRHLEGVEGAPWRADTAIRSSSAATTDLRQSTFTMLVHFTSQPHMGAAVGDHNAACSLQIIRAYSSAPFLLPLAYRSMHSNAPGSSRNASQRICANTRKLPPIVAASPVPNMFLWAESLLDPNGFDFRLRPSHGQRTQLDLLVGSGLDGFLALEARSQLGGQSQQAQAFAAHELR